MRYGLETSENRRKKAHIFIEHYRLETSDDTSSSNKINVQEFNKHNKVYFLVVASLTEIYTCVQKILESHCVIIVRFPRSDER